MSVTVELEGFEEMEASLKRLGSESAQKIAEKAASPAGDMALAAIRAAAPVGETGYLRDAIIPVKEHSRTPGKQVYQVTFASAYNSVLQKPIRRPGILGGKSRHAYYPASQEFGFLARAGGGGTQYVPGKYFMRDAAASIEAAAAQRMTEKAGELIEKEWNKHG